MVRKSRSGRKVSPPDEAFAINADDGVVVNNDGAAPSYKWEDPEGGDVAGNDNKAVEDLKLEIGPANTQDPEDQANLHDQLPSVEEAKLWNKTPSSSLNKRKIAMGLGICMVFVATILGLKMAMSGKGKGETYEVLTDRTEEMVQFVLDHRLSHEPSIRDAGSPQRRAAQFLADGDLYTTQETIEQDYHKIVERYVLAVLYYGMNGAGWTHQLNFMSGMDHCKWHQTFQTNSGNEIRQGVECNSLGRITKLNLEFNNLRGTLPHELKHLGQLDLFHAQFNEGLHGNLPDALQHLPNLRSVGLQYCNLAGPIPSWIGGMTQLTALALGNNKFEGQFPTEVGKLHKLKFLALDNMGLKGSINEPLKNLKNLETLFLDNNVLSGQISELVESWSNMSELDLSGNMLDGTIPNALFNQANLPNLMVVDLHNNLFAGNLPENIYQNTNIQYLALQNNSLQGSITDRIGFLESLKHLDLSYNLLTGTVPNTIQSLTDLQYLSTSGNKFVGQRMMNFGQLTNLRELHMKRNGLSGTIPDWIGGLTHLRMLDLHENQVYGTIPPAIGKLTNLNSLLLNRNELTGTVPREMTNMHQLKVILLDKNSLSGNVQPICDSRQVKPTYFISDCFPGLNGKPEVDCKCCTACCADTDPTCNNKRWKSDFDPEWEYGFIRPSYKFDLTNLPAIATNEDYTGDIEEETESFDVQP